MFHEVLERHPTDLETRRTHGGAQMNSRMAHQRATEACESSKEVVEADGCRSAHSGYNRIENFQS